jgi:hypothetical protein
MLLGRVDLAAYGETSIVKAPDLALAGLSNGSLVALRSTARLTTADTDGLTQLFIVKSDSSALRQLTHDSAGVVEAVLAGNGLVAYAVTAAGRLIRIDVPSDTVSQLIGRTVSLNVPSPSDHPFPVAGSAFCISGTGLADFTESTAAPLPSTLNGLQLLLDGVPLPLQSAGPTLACFQIPWDTANGVYSLSAITDADPQFEGGSTSNLEIDWSAIVNFVPLGPQYALGTSLQPYPLAAHQDFESLVSADPPAALTNALSCDFSDFRGDNVSTQVVFAGFGPGLTGYYQADVRIPDGVPV